ncbi:MAG: hypothetical protein ABI766_05580 [Gemmatimonadales bacterium]
MPRSLWFSETAIKQINEEYLRGIDDGIVAVAAKEELIRELAKLAADPPTQGHAGGPFETRPTHAFTLKCAGRRRAMVSYRIDDTKNQLQVLLFTSLPT